MSPRAAQSRQYLGSLEPAPRSVLYELLAAAIVKISVLLINGPSIFLNADEYIAYADAILDHGRAFAPVVWGAEALPPFIFRFPGYPLLLAGAKFVFPTHFAFVAVIFQCVLNLAATYLIFRVTERLLQSRGAALLVAGIYIISESMLWDNSIMPDSIYGSLFNIVVFGLLGHLLGCWRLTLGRSAGLAALWGYSVLTRDSGLYFTILPIMLTIAIAIRSEGSFACRLSHFLVFALVVGGMMGMYVMLNRYRTGEAFFSITGLENWLHPVFDMAQYGYAQPFTGDDLVSHTVRETVTDYGWMARKQLGPALHERCQCTPTQEQSLVFAKYLWAVCHYPIAYMRVIFVNFRGLESLLADPSTTINQFVKHTPLGRIFRESSLNDLTMLAHNFSVTTFIPFFVAAISKTISTIALSLLVLGIPTIILCKWHAGKAIDDTLAAVSCLWLSFMTVSLAFSLVHIERRHALPLIPAGLVCVVYTLQWLRAGLHRRMLGTHRKESKSLC